MTGLHLGRAWSGLTEAEKNCPCPKAECGLVAPVIDGPECPEHFPRDWMDSKTMRQMHPAKDCPGAPAAVRTPADFEIRTHALGLSARSYFTAEEYDAWYTALCARVWDEGNAAGWNDGARANTAGLGSETPNPYRESHDN